MPDSTSTDQPPVACISTVLQVAGDRTVSLPAGRFRSADAVVLSASDQTVAIPPPLAFHVHAERYAALAVWDEKAAPWRRGTPLLHARAQEVTVERAVEPGSLVVSSDAMASDVYDEGADYRFDPHWGTVGRVPDGRIGEDQAVYAHYRCGAPCTATLYVDRDGCLRVSDPVVTQTLPQEPRLPGGATAIATLWLPPRAERLRATDLYPVTTTLTDATALVAVSGQRADTCLPRTRATLRAGAPLRVLAWGDSVTDGGYLVGGPTERWQAQLLRALPPAVQAQIELHTVAWGGRTTKAFLAEPPGSQYHFAEQVIARQPDLVISEFVNDCGLPPAAWERLYPEIRDAFRAHGIEWIILTPHYTRPDWMGLADQRDCDADPRPYVLWLRQFAADHGIALADASLLWGQLYRRGIPYRTLLGNDVNHPDARGMRPFVDAILPWLTV